MNKFLVGLLAVAALGGTASAASASTINVNTTDDEYNTGAGCSLREAIVLANGDLTSFGGCTVTTNESADVIELQPGATYPRTLNGNLENIAATGDLDIRFEPLTIHGNGATVAGNLTDAGDRVFGIDGGSADVTNMGVKLTDMTIKSGRLGATSGGGGGFVVEGGAIAEVVRTTISNNFADAAGGAVWVTDSGAAGTALFLHDSTVFNNQSNRSGGGIFTTTNADALLNNDTIAGNTADNDFNDTTEGGGGIAVQFSTANMSLANTIVAGNTDASTSTTNAPDCVELNSGNLLTDGHNLIGNHATGCTGMPATGTGDKFDVPAGLAPTLASNGGPAQTLALQPGSQAIDAGDPSTPAEISYPSCTPTSENGVTRPTGSACDIGAYEVPPPPPGTTTAPGNPTSSINPAGNVRKRKCKKKSRTASAAKKKCKKKK